MRPPVATGLATAPAPRTCWRASYSGLPRPGAAPCRIARLRYRSAISRRDGASAELRLSESLEKFSVAVVATDDGRFAYQVFLVCGEPRTLLTDSARYLTPADAAQAGYEAVASMSETPVRRPYAPSSSRHHRGTPSQASD
jgi:hypothetical protein